MSYKFVCKSIIGVTATALLLATRLPIRARRWAMPLQGLGQAAALTGLIVAASQLDASAAFGEGNHPAFLPGAVQTDIDLSFDSDADMTSRGREIFRF